MKKHENPGCGTVVGGIVGVLCAVYYAVIAIGYALAAIYCFVAGLCFLIMSCLDAVFNANLVSSAPWMMWVACGAILGVATGFWTISPVYGLRSSRPAVLVIPPAVMLVVALLRGVLAMSNQPDLSPGSGGSQTTATRQLGSGLANSQARPQR